MNSWGFESRGKIPGDGWGMMQMGIQGLPASVPTATLTIVELSDKRSDHMTRVDIRVGENKLAALIPPEGARPNKETDAAMKAKGMFRVPVRLNDVTVDVYMEEDNARAYLKQCGIDQKILQDKAIVLMKKNDATPRGVLGLFGPLANQTKKV